MTLHTLMIVAAGILFIIAAAGVRTGQLVAAGLALLAGAFLLQPA